MKVTAKRVSPTFTIELTNEEAQLLLILFGGLTPSEIKHSLKGGLTTMKEYEIHTLTDSIFKGLMSEDAGGLL